MRRIPFIALALAAASCGHSRVYLNRDVATALVLAPFNDSKDDRAPWKMWKYVEREVARRGYALVPHDKVWQFYESKKYTADPGQITEYSTAELAKLFNVDAVVRSNVIEWGATTLVLYNSVDVKLEAAIYDRNGDELWKGEGHDGYSQAPSKRGLLGSTLGAVATDPEKYAGGAAANCFGGLPWAGWDPEMPRSPAPEPPAK
jgi:hypothetical protein